MPGGQLSSRKRKKSKPDDGSSCGDSGHEKEYRCIGCPQSFPCIDALKKHLEDASGNPKSICWSKADKSLEAYNIPNNIIVKNDGDGSQGSFFNTNEGLLPRLRPRRSNANDGDESNSQARDSGCDRSRGDHSTSSHDAPINNGSESDDITYDPNDADSEESFDDGENLDARILNMFDEESCATEGANFDPAERFDDNTLSPADVGYIGKFMDDNHVNLPWPKIRKGRIIDFSDDPIPPHEPIHAPVNSKEYNYLLSHVDRLLLRLYDLAEHAEAKLYFVDEMLKIIKEEFERGFDFSMKIPSRKAFFRRMKKEFPVPEPTPHAVSLEGPSKNDENYEREARDKAYVVCYNFHDLVDSAYSDLGLYGNLRNLEGCVDLNNPFGNRLASSDGSINEIQDARWWDRTKRFVDNLMEKEWMANPDLPREDYVIEPVSIYADKTASDKLGRRGIEPIVIQFHRLNRMCRQQPRSKRVLAYIPDCNRKSKVAKQRARETIQGKGRSVRNYHKCLKKALQSFFDGQGFDQKVVAWVRVGDQVKMCRVFFPFVMFLGDAKSQDVICGRYGSIFCSKPCRACLVPFGSLPNYLHKCQWRNFDFVRQFIEVALKGIKRLDLQDGDVPEDFDLNNPGVVEAMAVLKDWSMHAHVNAFQDHPMHGHRRGGILSATPTDPMHAFLHGVLDYVIKTYVDYMSPIEKHVLDKFVDQVLVPQKQSERKMFPRVNFTNGVTNLTQITAEEWAGVAFTLLVFLMTQPGLCVHNSMVKRKFAKVPAEERTVEEVVPMDPNKLSQEGTQWEDFAEDDGDSKYDEQVLNYDRHDSGQFKGKLKGKVLHSKMRRKLDRKHIIWILEKSLSFYAWYRRGAPYKHWYQHTQKDGTSGTPMNKRVDKEIRRYVGAITEFLPRMTGQGWFLQKIHEIMHIVRDMDEFGAVMNFDCGVWESLLRFLATRPGRLVRSTSVHSFLMALNQRVTESAVSCRVFQHAEPVNGVKLVSRVHSVDFDKVQDKRTTQSYFSDQGDDTDEEDSSDEEGGSDDVTNDPHKGEERNKPQVQTQTIFPT